MRTFTRILFFSPFRFALLHTTFSGTLEDAALCPFQVYCVRSQHGYGAPSSGHMSIDHLPLFMSTRPVPSLLLQVSTAFLALSPP